MYQEIKICIKKKKQKNFAVLFFRNVEETMMKGFPDSYWRGEQDDWLFFINIMKEHVATLLSNQTFYQVSPRR